jgi:hypothetical protein
MTTIKVHLLVLFLVASNHASSRVSLAWKAS